jgi:hypothetical protein
MPHDSLGSDPRRDDPFPNRASTLLNRMRPLCGSILEDYVLSLDPSHNPVQKPAC